MTPKLDRRSEETLMLAVFQSAEAQALAAVAFPADETDGPAPSRAELLQTAYEVGQSMATLRLRLLGYTEGQVEKARRRYDEVVAATTEALSGFAP